MSYTTNRVNGLSVGAWKLADGYAFPDHPVVRGMVANAVARAICSERFGAHKKARPSAVRRLFGWKSPSAILRRIWSVRIDPIYRVFFRRAWSHVLEKRIEGPIPSVADRNISSAIEVIHRATRIFAALLHRRPDLPLRSFLRLQFLQRRKLANVASARSTVPVDEIPAKYDLICTAVAGAAILPHPSPSEYSGWKFLHDHKLSEPRSKHALIMCRRAIYVYRSGCNLGRRAYYFVSGNGHLCSIELACSIDGSLDERSSGREYTE